MKSKKEEDRLIVYFSGEIDHCYAEKTRSEMEHLLDDRKIRLLTMDFTHVSFMDSSGVGMIIGRYKTMLERGGRVCAQGLQPHVMRLFRMAGLHRIIELEDAEDGK